MSQKKKTTFKHYPYGFFFCLWWLVCRYRRFLVTTHVRPDGDAVGSSVALVMFLKHLGKEVVFALEEPLDQKYTFLLETSRVVVWQEDKPVPSVDVAFVLDSGDISRIGKIQSWLGSAVIVNIDHHKDNTFFGSLNWVDDTASSVGEMLVRWLGGRAKGEIAQALFLSLATDTGFFRFSNASPGVYKMAARLLKNGASQTIVLEYIYQNRPFGYLLLLQRLLEHLELHHDGKLCIGYVSFEDMKDTNCFDTEGLLEYLALIKGVVVYVLLKEKEKGKISVSFRTRGNYDMSALAREFGGGGHTKAAGCLVEGDIRGWKEKILETIVNYMQRL
ncbi:MAG: DHH family phosphoesterase [Brevinematales bacterium]